MKYFNSQSKQKNSRKNVNNLEKLVSLWQKLCLVKTVYPTGNGKNEIKRLVDTTKKWNNFELNLEQ